MNCPTGVGTLRGVYDEQLKAEWDVCDRCHGVWFDDVELANAAKYFATKLAPREKTKISRVSDTGRCLPAEGHTCPRDAVAMESFIYAGDSGIVIDRCPTCFGIWLDGGELKKVEEFLRPDATADALARAVVDEMKDIERIKKDIASLPGEAVLAVSHPYHLVQFLVNFLRDVIVKQSGG